MPEMKPSGTIIIRQVETTSYWNHGQPTARRTSDGIATAMTAAMIVQISARHQPGRVEDAATAAAVPVRRRRASWQEW